MQLLGAVQMAFGMGDRQRLQVVSQQRTELRSEIQPKAFA
jgi:hypothetical protein